MTTTNRRHGLGHLTHGWRIPRETGQRLSAIYLPIRGVFDVRRQLRTGALVPCRDHVEVVRRDAAHTSHTDKFGALAGEPAIFAEEVRLNIHTARLPLRYIYCKRQFTCADIYPIGSAHSP